ncbi:unnamed protein product [Rotaria sp. Silwood1]|nr:unnamed protein product [Rotaria sp. Silwood1]
MGYATEALYTSIVFGFERLGLTKIIMQTDEKNEAMREWCEKTAGLKVAWKNDVQINGYEYTQCGYTFTIDEWNRAIKQKLEMKMNNIIASRARQPKPTNI